MTHTHDESDMRANRQRVRVCARHDDRWGIVLFYVQWATARRVAHRRRRKKWQRARAARYWPISKVISARVPPPRLGAVVVGGGVACTAATAQSPISYPSAYPPHERARRGRHNGTTIILYAPYTHTHTHTHTFFFAVFNDQRRHTQAKLVDRGGTVSVTHFYFFLF